MDAHITDCYANSGGAIIVGSGTTLNTNGGLIETIKKGELK